MSELFINKAKNILGNNYLYDKINYVNMKKPITIICKKHGEFEITPSNVLYYKKGCNNCFKEIKQEKLKKEFIKKANVSHNNKYDYSSVDYINSKTKVKIICLDHGIFEQEPRNHIKHGCLKCNQLDKDKYIRESNEAHGNIYSYKLIDLSEIKIEIICPIHGMFKQNKYHHMRGVGCPKCDKTRKKTKGEFIKSAKEIHENKYDYSLVVYKNNSTKVDIICKEHGIFNQTPVNHISNKNGCPSCTRNKKYTTKTFIKRAMEVHGNKYDYSLVNYKNSISKVNIVCTKHGTFHQVAASHIRGMGCKKCADHYIMDKGENDYIIYRKLIRRYTQRQKEKLFKEWDGYDYYDNEYIKPYLNLNHTNPKYPSIDHKISVLNGFLNNIPADKICEMNNLCITKRTINSSKQFKNEKNFNI